MLAEDLKVCRTSRSEGPRRELDALMLLRLLLALSTIIVLGLGLAQAGVHLLVVLVEINRALVVGGDVSSASLGPVVCILVPATTLERALLLLIPPLMPFAVFSAALHQRNFHFMASRIRFPELALLELVPQLAGTVAVAEIDLLTHVYSEES
ncbi:hypothetical protein F5Y10DRAFT_252350 [Nemania abortiva]|nr:hypothetical protein F5Y10DRAFT_252350 [Nemania abortiva]